MGKGKGKWRGLGKGKGRRLGKGSGEGKRKRVGVRAEEWDEMGWNGTEGKCRLGRTLRRNKRGRDGHGKLEEWKEERGEEGGMHANQLHGPRYCLLTPVAGLMLAIAWQRYVGVEVL